jgi:hypothetical protein
MIGRAEETKEEEGDEGQKRKGRKGGEKEHGERRNIRKHTAVNLFWHICCSEYTVQQCHLFPTAWIGKVHEHS